MQRHSSWDKKAPSTLSGLSRMRKEYDADANLKLLKLVDRGEEYTDQFLVYFQGNRVHFGATFEDAARVYDQIEKENF